MTTAADAIVRLIENSGERVIFGYPGGHTIPFHDALARSGKLRHVLVRHEQAAAIMADAYGRVKGRPGLCLVTAGPGATNTLSGVGEAYSDCTPLVVFACQVQSRHLGHEHGAYHEADIEAAFAPLTKWSATARRPEEAVRLAARALADSRRGRPRPVAVILPSDVLEQPVNMELPIAGEAERMEPQAGLDQAIELLARAEQPVIYAGGGVTMSAAGAELVALAEHIGAPVLTSVMGKGTIPEDHRLAAGYSRIPVAHEACRAADVMLAVGCRFTEVSTSGWRLPVPEKLIHVDVDPTPFGQNYPPAAAVLGDARLVLGALAEGLAPHRERAEAAAQRLRELWEVEHARRETTPGAYLIAPLRRVLPRNAIVACDVTAMALWLYAQFPVYEPNTLLSAAAYITMGWGVPAAAGAKIAAPERPVVAVTGDGGFMMSCQELATIASEGLDLTIVIVNDQCLSTIARLQDTICDGRRYAVNLVHPDFVAFANSFGIAAERVEADTDPTEALQRGLGHEGPYLIELARPPF